MSDVDDVKEIRTRVINVLNVSGVLKVSSVLNIGGIVTIVLRDNRSCIFLTVAPSDK
jgi:hypothetical protein